MNNAQLAARLWVALEGGSMGTISTCIECGATRIHKAHGLCRSCYTAQLRATAPPKPRNEVTRGLLPVPPMVRCAGAPGLRCTRQARADVGRCFRCQQE